MADASTSIQPCMLANMGAPAEPTRTLTESVREKWLEGQALGNKERLKGILGRQAAAAERERLDEEAASAKAENVKSVRVQVIQNGKNNELTSKPTSLK